MEKVKNQRSSDFSKDVERYRKLLRFKQQGSILLGTKEDGAPLFLNPDHLKTHLLIMGPTGSGKTYLARQIFRSLAPLPWVKTIVADDPKGDLFAGFEQDAAALGLAEKTILFDTSRNNRILAFNPLRRNGLAIEDQTLWILGGIRASWGEENFQRTPQLARWLFNSLFPVIEGEGVFPDALQLLHVEENLTRQLFVSRTSNELIRQEWQAYEALGITRRREETASAFARLRPFCTNPTIERIINQKERFLDLGDVLKKGGILLTTFPRYRPLEPELANLLRSLFLQSVLAQAFAYPYPEMRPPLYIILDEAEHALANDTGVIATILNEGRSLGIHLILCCHTLTQIAQKDPNLLALVLTNARTKILGGRLSQEDLKILSEELFVEEWNPWIVKDEIETLELEPIETTRLQVSRGSGTTETLGESFARSLGLALGETITRSLSHTVGEALGESITESLSKSKGLSTTNSLQKSHGQSSMHGGSHSQGVVTSQSAGTSSGQGSGLGMGDGMVMNPDGEVTWTSSNSQSIQNTEGQFSAEGTAQSETWGTNWSEGQSQSESFGLARSQVEAITQGITRGLTRTISQSFSEGLSHAQSRTESESFSETVSRSLGLSENQSVAESAWYEYLKRMRVSSRQFLILEEFLTQKLIKLKSQKLAHFAIKPPDGKAVFFKAVWIKPLIWSITERLNKFREQILSQSYYANPEEIENEKTKRLETINAQAKASPKEEPKKGTPKEPTTYRRKKTTKKP